MSDYGRRQGLILRVGLCGASGAYAIPPTPLESTSSWLLKVAISRGRGDIFQHKAVLSYLTFTYSCHVLPSCLQVAFKMAQDRNLGPTWPNLAPSWPHLGSQEAPKRPPRGPKRPYLHHKNEHFVWEGLYFFSFSANCLLRCPR